MNELIEKYQLWVFPYNGRWYAGQLHTLCGPSAVDQGYVEALFRVLESGHIMQEAVERAATVLGHPGRRAA